MLCERSPTKEWLAAGRGDGIRVGAKDTAHLGACESSFRIWTQAWAWAPGSWVLPPGEGGVKRSAVSALASGCQNYFRLLNAGRRACGKSIFDLMPPEFRSNSTYLAVSRDCVQRLAFDTRTGQAESTKRRNERSTATTGYMLPHMNRQAVTTLRSTAETRNPGCEVLGSLGSQHWGCLLGVPILGHRAT